jgi:hypothetical protein
MWTGAIAMLFVLASCSQVDHAGATLQAGDVLVYLRVCPPDGIMELQVQRARGHAPGDALWTATLVDPSAKRRSLPLLAASLSGYQITGTTGPGLLDDQTTFWVYLTSTSRRTASLAFKKSDLRADTIFKDSRTNRYEPLQHWLDATHCS